MNNDLTAFEKIPVRIFKTSEEASRFVTGHERVLTLPVDPFAGTITSGTTRAPRYVAQVPVPPGCVLQVRLITSDAHVVMHGRNFPVRVPSGPQTGIKIFSDGDEPPFPIAGGQTTAIRIDYDPNESLIVNRGRGVMERPVLRAVLVEAEFALGMLTDEVVITFRPGTSDVRIANVLAACDATFQAQYPHEFVTARLPTDGVLREAIECFQGQADVHIVLPNTLLDLQGRNPFPDGDPNDPLYTDPAPAGFESLNFTAVRALEAWRVTTGSAAVVIAVVDNGFDLLHEDLMYNIWINEGEIPPAIRDALVDLGEPGITFRDLNAIENDGLCPKANSPPNDICDPLDLVNGGEIGYGWQDGILGSDDNLFLDDVIGWNFHEGNNLPTPNAESSVPHHGTGVAGLAAGIGNNTVAGTGIAWNVRLMPIRAFMLSNPPGTSFQFSVGNRLTRDSVVRGVRYAHESGANVINLSLDSAVTREDSETYNCPEKGLHFVPVDKWAEGVRRLADEWEQQIGDVADRAVLTLAMDNCSRESYDTDGVFFYPAFTTPRLDIGVTFVHRTMITVVSVRTFNPLSGEPGSRPDLASFSSFGAQTALIAAPGDGWRIYDVQAYPPSGLSQAISDCDDEPGGLIERCQGNSLAAPVVAGAAALVLSNDPTLDAAGVRARILDGASSRPDIFNDLINGNRLLDVANSVGP